MDVPGGLDATPDAPALPPPHAISSEAAAAAARLKASRTSVAPAYSPYARRREARLPRPYVPPAKPTHIRVMQYWGAAAGTAILIASMTVAGIFITSLAEIGQDPAEAFIVIAISVVVGTVFGYGTLYYAARTFAKVVAAIVALVLVTGGLAMMVAAPVVHQMNTPGLAEYRGFAALLWFGAASTMAGAAIAAVCVRWSMERDARRALARWSRFLGSAYGVMLGLAGVGAIMSLLALIDGEATIDDQGDVASVVEQAIAITAIAMLSLVPGLILTYHGISESMGEGSGEFKPPLAGLAVLLLAIVLTIGQANMRAAEPAAFLMPPLHVLAGALPGIALIAMAARGTPLLRGVPVRGVTWRQITLAAAVSMTLGVNIALYVESIGAAYSVVLLLVHHGAFEFARNSDDVFNAIGDASIILTDNEQFVAGFITAAILAPLAEEFSKSLGVRFLMRPASTRAQVFVLGAAAGAGFGFLESQLYGLAGVQEQLSGWYRIMIARAGATSLHVLCTGLAGLAWWYFSVARRHGVAMALFGTAIGLHAAWNGVFTVLDSRIFGLDTISNQALEAIAYTIVGVASVMFVALVPLIASRLREPPLAPAETTPLSTMSPWVA